MRHRGARPLLARLDIASGDDRSGKFRVGPPNPVPVGAPLSYVALFSNEAGWTPDDDRALADIARNGTLAVGIDTKDYLQNLQANRNAVRRADCVDFFQDVEDLSRQVQGRHPSPFYNLPIVAGLGEGGAIAYAALAQLPIATLSAAISADPTQTLDIPRSLCRLDLLSTGGERHA